MCLLIFIRISAATECNFTEILKAQKLKISCQLSRIKILYYFAPFGFGIAEYYDRPIIEKKNQGGGVCPGKWTQILENEVHCPGYVWKNYGMYVHAVVTLSCLQGLTRYLVMWLHLIDLAKNSFYYISAQGQNRPPPPGCTFYIGHWCKILFNCKSWWSDLMPSCCLFPENENVLEL